MIDGAAELQGFVVRQAGNGARWVRRVGVGRAGLEDLVTLVAGVGVGEDVVVAEKATAAGGVDEATECPGGDVVVADRYTAGNRGKYALARRGKPGVEMRSIESPSISVGVLTTSSRPSRM